MPIDAKWSWHFTIMVILEGLFNIDGVTIILNLWPQSPSCITYLCWILSYLFNTWFLFSSYGKQDVIYRRIWWAHYQRIHESNKVLMEKALENLPKTLFKKYIFPYGRSWLTLARWRHFYMKHMKFFFDMWSHAVKKDLNISMCPKLVV